MPTAIGDSTAGRWTIEEEERRRRTLRPQRGHQPPKSSSLEKISGVRTRPAEKDFKRRLSVPKPAKIGFHRKRENVEKRKRLESQAARSRTINIKAVEGQLLSNGPASRTLRRKTNEGKGRRQRLGLSIRPGRRHVAKQKRNFNRTKVKGKN